MARTVAFSQLKNEPDWLVEGKHALKIERGELSEQLHVDRHQADSLDTRTARRFARIAAFLEQDYPDYFSGQKQVRAGSAALIEFIKLKESSPQRAQELAETTLAGELAVAQLKAELEKVRTQKAPSARSNRLDASRWAIDFENLVLRRLSEGRLLPDSEKIEEIEVVKSREALAPDILVHYKKNGSPSLAIEVKAPRDTAARAGTTVAAELISRMAALMLRYDYTLLVLPQEAEGIAQETVRMWRKWTDVPGRNLPPLTIMLLGPDRNQWIS